MFTSEFFIANRTRLNQLFTGTAPIVITAHGRMQQGSDEAYPFHQDRSFLYLTGIDEPGVILVIDRGKEYLIVPDRDEVIEKFDGVLDLEAMSRTSGVTTVYEEKEGWRHLSARLKKVKHVATLGASPHYVDFLGMYTNPARAELIQSMKKINGEIELLDLRPHLAKMRTIKQEVEIEAIQAAIDATNATLKAIFRPKQLGSYSHEYEIEADLTHGFRKRGTMGHAFAPIVASGIRTCMMHYNKNDAPLATGDLLLLDVGAKTDHYSADIARTVVLGGNPTKRHLQVHEAVKESQHYAFSLLKPGVMLREYEKQMESFVGEKLRELGLIKTIEKSAVRQFFPHATSHFLGLDTHDGGDYDVPLAPGVVLTVEPGIYIPNERLGIRIEDDILITENGNRILSEALSRELA